ncbi:MAG: hypothetical protein SBU_000097 [Candidatus Syntrophoarchaeum butanivorans]|uniref:Uncharacterized protein n=1 Tax=Candidatus Syntropharchaeum butanivorans TaxID=1839936 RepID=A0A1F2P6L0_9EURY|nr:MAG: hypothetical protein SBU_000097 [Candidatus Syntrophoarchaeum butanivorans]
MWFFGKVGGKAVEHAPKPVRITTPEYEGLGIRWGSKSKPLVGKTEFSRIMEEGQPVKVDYKALVFGTKPVVKSVKVSTKTTKVSGDIYRIGETTKKEVSLGNIAAYEKYMSQLADVKGYFLGKETFKQFEPRGTGARKGSLIGISDTPKGKGGTVQPFTPKTKPAWGFELVKPFYEEARFERPQIHAVRYGYRKLRVGHKPRQGIYFGAKPRYSVFTEKPYLPRFREKIGGVRRPEIGWGGKAIPGDYFVELTPDLKKLFGFEPKPSEFKKWADKLGKSVHERPKKTTGRETPQERWMNRFGKSAYRRTRKPATAFKSRTETRTETRTATRRVKTLELDRGLESMIREARLRDIFERVGQDVNKAAKSVVEDIKRPRAKKMVIESKPKPRIPARGGIETFMGMLGAAGTPRFKARASGKTPTIPVPSFTRKTTGQETTGQETPQGEGKTQSIIEVVSTPTVETKTQTSSKTKAQSKPLADVFRQVRQAVTSRPRVLYLPDMRIEPVTFTPRQKPPGRPPTKKRKPRKQKKKDISTYLGAFGFGEVAPVATPLEMLGVKSGRRKRTKNRR